jgi:hypothetical protein
MKNHLLVSGLITLLSLPLPAQTTPTTGGEAGLGHPNQSENVALRGKKKDGAPDNKSADAEATPRVKFPRKWDEGRAQLRVVVENPEATELKIEGVQTSAGLFVTKFPASIKAGASEEMVLQYVARTGAGGDIDSVRLLTNQGEKVIEVMQNREAAFTVSARTLDWKVNDALAAKTITITTTKANLRPVGLRVLGAAKPKTEIRNGPPGQFFVDITPASTATPAHFAVMIEFEPAVPGAVSVIQCAIKPAN